MTSFDVLICGAGASGLYCAKRVLEEAARSGQILRVGVLESGDRVGGRIRTRKFADFPDTPIELGPMRFLEQHTLVRSLVEEYRLETVPFSTGADTRFSLGGSALTEHPTFTRAGVVDLRVDEVGRSPAELLGLAIGRLSGSTVGPDADAEQCRVWLEGLDPRTGLRDLLTTVISPEAFDFVKAASGYDSSFENWNSREALAHIVQDFHLEPRSFMLADGFEALVGELEADIRRLGGRFLLNSQLRSFRPGSHGTVDCDISDRRGNRAEVVTGSLVLAVPQEGLAAVIDASPGYTTPHVADLVASVSAQSAVKIFFSYDRAWWKDLPESFETITTDLPLRKVYYQLRETVGGEDDGGILLAAYADMAMFDYWNRFIDADDRNEETTAPPDMVETVTGMLSELHGFEVPRPIASKVIRWSPAHAGSAYHAWNPGVDCAEVMNQIARPIDDVPVYVCGEAFSRYQCWIEGALSSAEALLQRFPLATPRQRTHDAAYSVAGGA